MTFVLADRVKEISTTTGAGDITLLGSETSFDSFSSIGDGNSTFYVISHRAANEWEVGVGTFKSPDTLSRDTVLASSNGGSPVSFSTGTKDVFVSQPSSKAVYKDPDDLVSLNGSLEMTSASAIASLTRGIKLYFAS